ncbi:MAG: dihydroorotase [Microcoleaceae cyanobacterium]
MSGELLKNVRIIDPVSNTDRQADVLIVDQIIQQIQPEIVTHLDAIEVLNCEGMILGSGLVDLYSHTGEPGFEDRETLHSLMQAGLAGGFTRIGILPDTLPTVDNPATLSLLQHKTQLTSQSLPQLYFWGALTQNIAGKQMTELAELASTNIIGFTDGQPIQDLVLLRRLLEYLKPLNLPVALYCCDRALAMDGVMREGNESIRSGLPGIPVYAETAALSTVLELVAEIQTPVHLMRISTRRSVELIQQAKSRNLPVTASTTWMHLLLNTTAISGNHSNEFSITPYDPNLNLDPPLGNLTDQAALIQGIKTGIIDAIAIDHTPYTYEEKTVAFADTPPGVIGLELALPLLWQRFVESGEWSALELWQTLSLNPALCLGKNINPIIPNKPTELILFNPQQLWEVEYYKLQSRAFNTPWRKQELLGRVVATWCENKK